jgi:hypothetical protein
MFSDSARPRQAKLHNPTAKVKFKERKKPKRKYSPASLRLGEVRRILFDRYGGYDADHEDLRILLHCRAKAAPYHRRKRVVLEEIETWASWMPDVERAVLAHEIVFNVIVWSAAKLGHALKLTLDDRERLGIKTIRPYDLTAREFRAYQKKRKRMNVTKRRRAQGKRTREQYFTDLALASKSSAKPWLLIGISRPTYYRLRLHLAAQQGVRRGVTPVVVEEGLVESHLVSPLKPSSFWKPIAKLPRLPGYMVEVAIKLAA